MSDASRDLRALLDVHSTAGTPRYNVELAFEEVVANIIRHAAATRDVEVAICFSDDEIVMTFEDDGVFFDPHTRPDPVPPTSIDDAPVGGLGLVLLKKIATRLEYKRTSRERHERNVLTIALPAAVPNGNAPS
jgi:anti-sigma regulatory factor (Ser/Thr protein kinase)